MTKFKRWAQQFETRVEDGKRIPAKCLFPEYEGHHKVACRMPAHDRSLDNYPVCKFHKGVKVRPEWKGFVEGA